jgi:hypothetical protein
MSAELLIANFLRIAAEDLDGARLLGAAHNRNAIYPARAEDSSSPICANRRARRSSEPSSPRRTSTLASSTI